MSWKTRGIKRTRAALIERDGLTCHWCGIDIACASKATLDHLVPQSQGGRNTVENCVIACSPCNNERGDMPTYEFRKSPYLEKKRRWMEAVAKPSPMEPPQQTSEEKAKEIVETWWVKSRVDVRSRVTPDDCKRLDALIALAIREAAREALERAAFRCSMIHSVHSNPSIALGAKQCEDAIREMKDEP